MATSYSYSDYIDEITSDEIYDRLVGCGMFAEKIPDFLTSSEFHKYTKTLSLPLSSVKDKDYVRYSSMRNINIPRQMAIPEPFAYANLCHSISREWDRLTAFFRYYTRKEKHKVSRIHLRKMKDHCPLFEMNYKNYEKDDSPEEELLITSKYLVNADISNFFPSIYSHSIPWALKGKSFAKVNKGLSFWFNQIDFYIRSLKYGETNGVLIGPHASNLISEIILVKIDSVLVAKGYRYIRHIDDYSCYVSSFEEAERFLVDLSEELKRYELKLNDRKSEIIPLPQASVKKWVNKINNYIFNNTYRVNGQESIRLHELKSFFDFVVQLFLDENKDSAILNYAIKIIAKKYIGSNARTYYINQIHHLVLLFPYLIHLLDKFVFEPHHIPKDKIEEIASNIYRYGLDKHFYEANSYSLFWALKYDFQIKDIESGLSTEAEKSEDTIFLLLSFLYEKKLGRSTREYTRIAEKLKHNDFDRYWLFIYEVLPWDQLPGEYKTMKAQRLSFVQQRYRPIIRRLIKRGKR